MTNREFDTLINFLKDMTIVECHAKKNRDKANEEFKKVFDYYNKDFEALGFLTVYNIIFKKIRILPASEWTLKSLKLDSLVNFSTTSEKYIWNCFHKSSYDYDPNSDHCYYSEKEMAHALKTYTFKLIPEVNGIPYYTRGNINVCLVSEDERNPNNFELKAKDNISEHTISSKEALEYKIEEPKPIDLSESRFDYLYLDDSFFDDYNNSLGDLFAREKESRER